MPDVDQALSEAHIAAGKAHMHNLAMQAQSYEPDATVVVLSQSDQGENLSVSGFIVPGVADPDVAYDFDDDGEAMCLYTDVYVMRELYAQYDVRGDIEYSDRMGLRSFHMDIAKVLAELAPEKSEPVAIEFKGVKVTLYDSTTKPGTVSVQIETDEAGGQPLRIMLNDADLFVGDPNVDEHPWSQQVQEYYDRKGD